MTEGPGRHAGEEGDYPDRWLGQRDPVAYPGGARRATTSPPAWAPQVTTPPPQPELEPVVEVPAAPTVLIEEPAVEKPAPEESLVHAAAVDEPAPEEPVLQAPVAQTPVDAPPTEPDAPPPIRHTFRPRTRARVAVGVGALLAAAASVLGVYVASRERDAPSIGIAITLWVLTGIIWAVHSGTSVTRLSVRGGQLHVVRHGVRTTIDLTSSYTPVEVRGRAGKHGWKVVFRRRDMSAFVIDHSMVDPAEFMRVLRYYRPGIDAEGE